MPNSALVLPYVVEDEARKKPFTLNMEISAILCLAEAQRKKPGILDASSEKISFISKLHHPIWVVPWKDSCLLVDGLELLSYSLPYAKIPDVELFTEEMKRNVADKEQFHSSLREQVQTFEKAESTSISLEAIFAKEVLSVLNEYFEQVSALKEKPTERVALMSPKLDEKTALEKAARAVDLWRQIQSDIKGLQYAVSVLGEETSFGEEKILREIEHVQELYEAEIAPLKPIVEKRIEELFLKRDAKISKLDKSLERRLTARLKEKRRHEGELERLERNLIEYRKRRKMSKRRGDNLSTSKWEHRMKTHQNKLSETRRKLQSVSDMIGQIRKQSEFDVQEVKNEYQRLIENERRQILDLEASRKLEVDSKEKQIEGMKAEASAIVEQIWRLVELKKSEASRIDEVTIPHRVKAVTLLCLPFYLVRYETEEDVRYLTVPPVIAMDFKGIVRTLQKAVHRFSLQSRIKLLLRSKSAALENMLGKVLVPKIRSDKTLEENICELGVSNNILYSSGLKDALAKGIEELRNEGWVSQEEKEALLKTYL